MIKTYDLSTVQLAIGGFPISGYGQDGAISIAPAADIGEVSTGADGESTFSRSNNKDGVATITVKESSRGYRHLAALLKAQEAAVTIAPQPFFLIDPQNGDKISTPWSVFIQRPTVDKNRTASDRVFVLHLGGIYNTATLGVLNLIGI